MNLDLFKRLRGFFSKGRLQPDIVPAQGHSAERKKGFGVAQRSLRARRKALRVRQKLARRQNRR